MLEKTNQNEPSHCNTGRQIRVYSRLNFMQVSEKEVKSVARLVLCPQLQSGGSVEQGFALAEFAFEILHEFGHVVGLAHEEERKDAGDAGPDPACVAHYKEQSQNYDKDLQNVRKESVAGFQNPFGNYDRHSIMNYCSVDRGKTRTPEEVHLSADDVGLLNYLFKKGSQGTSSLNRYTVSAGEGIVSFGGQVTKIFLVPIEKKYCNLINLFRCLGSKDGNASCLNIPNSEFGRSDNFSSEVSIKDSIKCLRSLEKKDSNAAERLNCIPELKNFGGVNSNPQNPPPQSGESPYE